MSPALTGLISIGEAVKLWLSVLTHQATPIARRCTRVENLSILCFYFDRDAL